jgi:Flp pilus assembly protein TadD
VADVFRMTVPKGLAMLAPASGAPSPQSYSTAAEAIKEAERLSEALRPREAAVFFQRALELEPAHEVAVSALGFIYIDQGDQATALSTLRAFLEAHPGGAHARMSYARCLIRAGDLAEAVRQCQRCADERPNWDVPHNPLIVALSRLGRKAEAERVLKDFQRFSPDARVVAMLEKLIHRSVDPSSGTPTQASGFS